MLLGQPPVQRAVSQCPPVRHFTEGTLIGSHSAIEDMRYLVRKYPHGYEGSESRKPERDRS